MQNYFQVCIPTVKKIIRVGRGVKDSEDQIPDEVRAVAAHAGNSRHWQSRCESDRQLMEEWQVFDAALERQGD